MCLLISSIKKSSELFFPLTIYIHDYKLQLISLISLVLINSWSFNLDIIAYCFFTVGVGVVAVGVNKS